MEALMTLVVDDAEFCRSLDTCPRRAQDQPIQVLRNGKPTGYFIFIEYHNLLQRVLASLRQTFHPSELPADLMSAVKNARMDARHNNLEALLDLPE
jgi:hypothetical protein